jgi:EAL domain-containing protein (putative c-di-GMP-specific phosphodiesterase class I)
VSGDVDAEYCRLTKVCFSARFECRLLAHLARTSREFHKARISIALDDFGTGFASLTHLKQFPVDHIKIDQSFIRNLETDKDDAAIVAAVVGLGRSMGMKITAEGVENAGQAERLREAGCDSGQGYFYAEPTSGERVPWMIRGWSSCGQPEHPHQPNLRRA